eukprot:GFYU01006307.1.p1 GENE.GFYU01006307.1~~GFYU01006307.1.p1  ORF type:complete len:510 (-),score=188.09 GFYU01006307.1:394-1839(-)
MVKETFPKILTTGGDDRSVVLPETGRTKYYTLPVPMPELIARSSCTCSAPTQRGFKAAEALFEHINAGSESFDEVVDKLRSRIVNALGLPEKTGVMFMPSGTDAEYIPNLMARAFWPSKDILNIVTCGAEVGSGSAPAAKGEHFTNVAPLTGTVKKGERLEGFFDVECVTIPARVAETGEPVNTTERVESLLKDCETNNKVAVVHRVVCSKTGILEPEPPRNANVDTITVVDACQGRTDTRVLADSIQRGELVLFSGSKFFQGPPFCGCILIPEAHMTRLAENPITVPAGLKSFMTKYEVPQMLPSWREQLPDHQNVGLMLRWAASLSEIEPTLNIPTETRDQIITSWRQHALSCVAKHSVYEVMSVDDTDSIVSVKIRKPDASGFFTYDELVNIFRWDTYDLSDKVPEATEEEKTALKVTVLTGQPVKIGPVGVLRVALGADSLRRFHENPQETGKEDDIICTKMATTAKYYNTLLAAKV